MKTPENEAFDDLAKRQGAWGGGYQAKRQMAADKFCDANCVWTDHHPDCNMAADKLQEPVAIRLSNGMIDVLGGALVPIGTLLYLTPPQREWVGLTDAEIDVWKPEIHDVISVIEQTLKEKNT